MSSPNRFGANRVKAQCVAEISRSQGCVYISDTTKHTGPYSSVMPLADAVASLIESSGEGFIQGTLTSVPLPVAAGEIVGKFDTITLASGKILAYF